MIVFQMFVDGKVITFGQPAVDIFTLLVTQKEEFQKRLTEFRRKLQNARNDYGDQFRVVISRRSRVFEDTFRQFTQSSNLETLLKNNMYIIFSNEAGIDCGGVRR